MLTQMRSYKWPKSNDPNCSNSAHFPLLVLRINVIMIISKVKRWHTRVSKAQRKTKKVFEAKRYIFSIHLYINYKQTKHQNKIINIDDFF